MALPGVSGRVKWGDAKTYAWLHSVSGQQYQRQLMYWLECENPSLHKLVMKELKIGGDRGGSPDPAGDGGAEKRGRKDG